jgi:hypothetical protein
MLRVTTPGVIARANHLSPTPAYVADGAVEGGSGPSRHYRVVGSEAAQKALEPGPLAQQRILGEDRVHRKANIAGRVSKRFLAGERVPDNE